MRFILNDINAEPWKAPSFSGRGKGRRAYKAASLVVYQQAVTETVQSMLPPGFRVFDGDIELSFVIWRQIELWEVDGKRRRSHVADATNMQKALEDALQGVLFNNDRQVRRITTLLAAQDVGVTPCIVVEIQEYQP